MKYFILIFCLCSGGFGKILMKLVWIMGFYFVFEVIEEEIGLVKDDLFVLEYF